MTHPTAAKTQTTRLRLGALTRAGLVLSYQRYALALAAVAAGVVALALMIGGTAAIAIGAVAALGLLKFSLSIALRFGDKMRVTRIAMARIGQQRFRPETVRRHCSDPCFRIVANECLRRAGFGRRNRHALIARYRTELRDAPATLLLRDPTTGRTIFVGGQQQQQQS